MIYSFFRRGAASLVFTVFFVTTILAPIAQAAEVKDSGSATVQLQAPVLDAPTQTTQTSPVQDLVPAQVAPAQNVAPVPETPLPTPQAAVQGATSQPQDESSKETKRGKLPIQINNASGAANYSFPLDIPSGRGGMQPSLNLSYNSDSRDNMNFFGAGWSLDIGSVARTTRKGSDHLYIENDFTLDIFGNQKRLKPVALSDGKHGIYGAEIESDFEKIEFLADDSWLVTDKNGTTFVFGKVATMRQNDPADATHIYKWMISEVRDPNDNFIRFSYIKDAGQIIPDKIFYTGSGVADGIFEIDFIREQRPDVFSGYSTQFQVTNNFRISEINIKVSGVVRKRYSFSYNAGGNGSRTLLQSITKTGIDSTGASLTLPPDQFTYNQKQKNWTETPSWRLPVAFEDPTANDPDKGFRFAEVNGDGLPDIVMRITDVINKVYLNSGSGWQVDPNWQLPVNTVQNGGDSGTRLADVNGDGLTDIIALQNQPTPLIYINNKTSWQPNPDWHFPSPIIFNSDSYSWVQLEDVNADGLVDAIFQTIQNPAQGPTVYINNGNGNWTLDPNWIFPVSRFYVNGSPDIDMGVRFADINGDGLVDVIQARDQSQSPDLNTIHINTGRGWSLSNRRLPFMIVNEAGWDMGIRFVDVNGDGLADLLRGYSIDPGGIDAREIYLNNGNDWILDQNWQLPIHFDGINNGWGKGFGVQIIDANGDGLSDFLISRFDPNVAIWNKAYINTSNNNAQLGDVLTQVTEKEGGTTNVTYTPSTSYKDQQGVLLNKVPFVLHTVSGIDRNDNLGTVSTETYSYEGGSFYVDAADIRKNTFAGFAHVKNTSGTGDITSSNFFVDNYSLMGRMYRQDSFEQDGRQLGGTFSNFSHSDIGNGRYLVQLDSQVAKAL
ncbi:MAG: FG-GAP-like repeat-containing protein, partial [Candidatus Gracilibacteria bacterium]